MYVLSKVRINQEIVEIGANMERRAYINKNFTLKKKKKKI